jgi:hypothetical protein
MERKNKNRGYQQLRVWQDAITLYVETCQLFKSWPFEMKRIAGQSLNYTARSPYGARWGDYSTICKDPDPRHPRRVWTTNQYVSSTDPDPTKPSQDWGTIIASIEFDPLAA